MIPIKDLNPVAVFLGTTVLGLAMLMLNVQNPILRLKISDVAIFLTVLFFYVLLTEEVEELKETKKGMSK